MKICRIGCFFAVMALVFHLTFHVAGNVLRGALAQVLEKMAGSLDLFLLWAGVPSWFHSLVADGIFPGVGSVLSFVPVIGVLFFFLSLLEETGYLSYAAGLMDGPMGRLDLPGCAIVPLTMSFGCNVPAILTAGTLTEGREKAIIIAMIPFLSCSARLPIYAMFINAFFADHKAAVMTAVYAIGILTALLTALVSKKVAAGPCPCSIPEHHAHYHDPMRLRPPSLRKVLRCVCQNCLAFIKKAFTVILAASVIVWFLQRCDPALQPAADPEASLLACLGRAAAPLFVPLGFGSWQAASALISGIFAKEAVVSTLAVLSSGSDPGAMLSGIFTPLSAFSFMAFCLLYIPCIAALAAAKQILGAKKALLLAVFQMAAAWSVSFLLFQAGTFIMQL